MEIQYEKPFESEICGWLDDHDWWYRDEPPYDLNYDRESSPQL